LISDIPRCKDITKLERRCSGRLAASGVVGGDPLLPPEDANDSDDVDDGELGACMMINYEQML